MQPCAGFTIKDESSYKQCSIKSKCQPMNTGISTDSLYMKNNTTIVRSEPVFSESVMEIISDFDAEGPTIGSCTPTGSHLDCGFLCLLYGTPCAGAALFKESSPNYALCCLKGSLEMITTNHSKKVLKIHKNPLQPLHNYLETFTRYEEKICVQTQAIADINFVQVYQCAEMCHTVPHCLGFTIEKETKSCGLKSICHPDTMQPSSQYDTYIMKSKSLCLEHCYTFLPDKVLNIVDAENACSARGQYLLTLETAEEMTSLYNYLSTSATVVLTSPLWLSLDPYLNKWRISDTESVALSWSPSWETNHPVIGATYALLNHLTGKFLSSNSLASAYAVCEAKGPFKVYGGNGEDIDGVNEESYFNVLFDNNYGSCLTLGGRDPLGGHYTLELLSSTEIMGGMLVALYGKNMNQADPGFFLMLASNIKRTSDGRQIKDAYYKHCKWMYETDRGGGIQEWLFHCQCDQTCGNIYLKIFKSVELCDMPNWY